MLTGVYDPQMEDKLIFLQELNAL
jgi:endonuclease/exonuclease/phosphatase family metal-dependent hydrolase